jgi:hypothetical protein
MQIIGEGAEVICSTCRCGPGRSGIAASSGSAIGLALVASCWSTDDSLRRWWKRRARWRLRDRSAPFLVLPSACLRARYSLVAGSRWARVIAITCRAWLSWRSPPRLSRCWVRLPDEHGIGAVSVCSPKLEVLRKPLDCGGVADQDRRGHRAAALLLQQLGPVRGDERGQLGCELVDPTV